MNIVSMLITLLVTSVGFYLISIIPLIGVEIDSFNTAIVSALVFGLLNAFIAPILKGLTLPMAAVFSNGLIALILNAIIFGIAAWLVQGFRLRNGVISALLGALALAFVNSILFQVLSQLGIR